MPACETIREEFSALLDGELDAETREAVESHLHECSDCLRELGRYKKVTGMYGRLERVPAPPGFEERVADAIRPKITPLPVRRKFFVRWEMALAAAAVLLIIAGTFVMLPTVHAPGTLQISKSKEAPPAQPEVQTAPREAAPEQPLYSEEKSVSDQAVDSSTLSQEYFTKGDVAGQAVETAAPVLTPAAPAPAPVLESLPGISQKNEVMEVQQERRRELPKPEPEAEPKPAPVLTAKAAMPAKDKSPAGLAHSGAVGGAAPAGDVLTSVPETMEADRVIAPPLAAAAPEAVRMEKRQAHGAQEKAHAERAAGINAASAPAAANEQTLEGKTFVYLADTWIEKGYADQAKTPIVRGSSQYQELLKQHPEIARYADLGARVVLKLDHTWYLLVRETKQP